MRHDPDPSMQASRAERHLRLFALHWQAAVQSAGMDHPPPVLLPQVAEMLQRRAEVSLGKVPQSTVSVARVKPGRDHVFLGTIRP